MRSRERTASQICARKISIQRCVRHIQNATEITPNGSAVPEIQPCQLLMATPESVPKDRATAPSPCVRSALRDMRWKGVNET